jgi:ABC-2 type transport system permease protein
VNPVLQKIGVNINNGTVVHPNDHEMPHILKAQLTPAGANLAQEQAMYLYKRKIMKVIETAIEGGANISYSTYSGFQVQPIIELNGNDKTWIENGVLVVDSAAPVFSAFEGDIKQDKYTLGIAMTRGKQRIIVTGDADMLTSFRNGTGNAFYSWLLYNNYPFYANYPGPTDKYFTAKPVSIKLLNAGYTYTVPALVLLFAIVLLVRRKRK